MALRDWLDAGERMLIEGASQDPLVLDVLHRLFLVESEPAMEAAFKELSNIATVRNIDFEKAVNEARKKAGVSRLVSEEELAAAVSDWPLQDNVKPEGDEDPD